MKLNPTFVCAQAAGWIVNHKNACVASSSP
jgi:hypothetical protein